MARTRNILLLAFFQITFLRHHFLGILERMSTTVLSVCGRSFSEALLLCVPPLRSYHLLCMAPSVSTLVVAWKK
jgi:hypothetical protein